MPNEESGKNRASQIFKSIEDIHNEAVILDIGKSREPEFIVRAIASAQKQKPTYQEFYPFLEQLFLTQAAAGKNLRLTCPNLEAQLVHTRWEGGFTILKRWDFPIDIEAAETILRGMRDHIPPASEPFELAHQALATALRENPDHKRDVWQSFLHHEWEPWQEWVEVAESNAAALLFWGRSCLRPSLEWVAEQLLLQFPLPASWLKGYCPICGSLPALLFLHQEGERKGYCSWCGTIWGLHRLQCPYCENHDHESLGYLFAEQEPEARIQYCKICGHYFKLTDIRERLDPPYLPLEEWTTLHLDILAQSKGWKQPPSPSPIVYREAG